MWRGFPDAAGHNPRKSNFLLRWPIQCKNNEEYPPFFFTYYTFTCVHFPSFFSFSFLLNYFISSSSTSFFLIFYPVFLFQSFYSVKAVYSFSFQSYYFQRGCSWFDEVGQVVFFSFSIFFSSFIFFQQSTWIWLESEQDFVFGKVDTLSKGFIWAPFFFLWIPPFSRIVYNLL